MRMRVAVYCLATQTGLQGRVTAQMLRETLTYFHLVKIRPSGLLFPLLHGTSMVSPYRPITVSTQLPGKYKTRTSCFRWHVGIKQSGCEASAEITVKCDTHAYTNIRALSRLRNRATRNGREDRQLRSCFDYSQDVHVMHLNFKLDVFADSESTKGTTQRSITKELCSRGGFSTHNRSGILSWEVHVFVIVCALACAFRHGMK